ncbi:PapI protein [Escherichia coli]|nr:PapI protein [Escherichia coli]
MLPSETMIWQPEFTDKTLSRKPGAVQTVFLYSSEYIDNIIMKRTG